MNPTRLRSTRHLFLTAVLAVGLSGCAALVTPGNPVDLAEPVRLATTVEPDQLRARAEQGDAQAQQALSLVLTYRLNGSAFDPSAAAVWRTLSLRPRGTMPITQYTAAFNGQPSRVNLIHVPRYDVTMQHDHFIARCAEGLHTGTLGNVCGDQATTEALREMWVQAAQHRR